MVKLQLRAKLLKNINNKKLLFKETVEENVDINKKEDMGIGDIIRGQRIQVQKINMVIYHNCDNFVNFKKLDFFNFANK